MVEIPFTQRLQEEIQLRSNRIIRKLLEDTGNLNCFVIHGQEQQLTYEPSRTKETPGHTTETIEGIRISW